MIIRLLCFALVLVCTSLQIPKVDQKSQSRKPLTPATLAGNYVFGDGFQGTTLTLTEDGKFSYLWFDDTGQKSRDAGTFEILDRIITFQAADIPKGEKIIEHTAPPKLHLIPWRNRFYLVKEKDMPAFCDLVNLGVEPRQIREGMCYLNWVIRKVDGEERADVPEIDKPIGLPEVPDPWQAKLHKQPVEGKIVEKLADGRARVNLGTADGLKNGMVLLADHDQTVLTRCPYRLVEIMAIETHRCTIAEMNQPFFHGSMKVDGKVRSRIEENYLKSTAWYFPTFPIQ